MYKRQVERRRKSGYRLLAVVRTDGKVTVKRRILPFTAELSERRLALCAALYKALCEGCLLYTSRCV